MAQALQQAPVVAILIECKLSKAPEPSRGFHQLVADLKPDAAWLAAPVDLPYDLTAQIRVGAVDHIHPDGIT